MFKRILVTGSNGQLAQCIKQITNQFPQLEFEFVDKNQLDISNSNEVANFFAQNTFTHLINTAAYTQVDKAEDFQNLAFKVNQLGAENIAIACEKHAIELIHVSTDYVFDGKAEHPYTETSETNPINIYGASKLAGEKAIIENCRKHIILRSSWLYSPYGSNFYLSIKKALESKNQLQITTEQIGTPTSALGLAEVLLKIIVQDQKEYGVYHYSDLGQATWYDFAMLIERKILGDNKGHIQQTSYYKTKAKRPAYSVLSQDKIRNKFAINSISWELALDKI